jgi:hypothetical protein
METRAIFRRGAGRDVAVLGGAGHLTMTHLAANAII